MPMSTCTGKSREPWPDETAKTDEAEERLYVTCSTED